MKTRNYVARPLPSQIGSSIAPYSTIWKLSPLAIQAETQNRINAGRKHRVFLGETKAQDKARQRREAPLNYTRVKELLDETGYPLLTCKIMVAIEQGLSVSELFPEVRVY